MKPAQPRRIRPDDAALAAALALIHTSFAYMEGRIDPPSRALELTRDQIAELARDGELWVIEEGGGRVVACVLLTPQKRTLALAHLAVAVSHRGRGLARRLVDLAERRARALRLGAVELRSRVEMTENHSAFAAMGFRLTDETAHPGFDHPTSVVFVKPA